MTTLISDRADQGEEQYEKQRWFPIKKVQLSYKHTYPKQRTKAQGLATDSNAMSKAASET